MIQHRGSCTLSAIEQFKLSLNTFHKRKFITLIRFSNPLYETLSFVIIVSNSFRSAKKHLLWIWAAARDSSLCIHNIKLMWERHRSWSTSWIKDISNWMKPTDSITMDLFTCTTAILYLLFTSVSSLISHRLIHQSSQKAQCACV